MLNSLTQLKFNFLKHYTQHPTPNTLPMRSLDKFLSFTQAIALN
ncbi:hypothetical protein WKK05_09080 [Nostoc sp. UHCC 0302]